MSIRTACTAEHATPPSRRDRSHAREAHGRLESASRRAGADAALAREDAEERAAHSVLRSPVWRRAVHLPVARSAREPEQHHRGLEGATLDHLSGSSMAGTDRGRCCCPRAGATSRSTAAGDRGRPVGDHEPHGAHGLAQPAGAALDVASVLGSRRESPPRVSNEYADSRVSSSIPRSSDAFRSPAGVQVHADAAGAGQMAAQRAGRPRSGCLASRRRGGSWRRSTRRLASVTVRTSEWLRSAPCGPASAR